MINQKAGIYFLPIVIFGLCVLTFFVFRPFLYSLVFAVVFATVCNPINKKISSFLGEWHVLSALVTTMIIMFGLLIPVVFLSTEVFYELGQMYASLTNSNGISEITSTINVWLADVQRFFPGVSISLVNINEYIRQGLSLLLQNFAVIFSNAAKIIAKLFVFLIALYYFIKDGDKIKKALIALSPLDDANDEMILNKLASASVSVVRGSLFIALIQGAIASLGFVLFGVPQPIFWGSIAAFSSFIPGVGTSIVLIPAILFLFLTHQTIQGFGMLVWSISVVGLVDNFLAPHLIGKGMKLHPLLVLLAVLGGIIFFGPSGLILGPLMVSLLFTLLGVYRSLAPKEKII